MNKKELLTDISAEIYRDDEPYALKIAAELDVAIGDRVLHDTAAQCLRDDCAYIKQLAKRIDAAAKRGFGNVAKLREVVEMIALVILPEEAPGEDGWLKWLREMQIKARAAIAARARQCDIGTAKEQAERMANFCKQQYAKSMPGLHICHKCKYHDNCTECECTFAWMQSPFKKSGVAK